MSKNKTKRRLRYSVDSALPIGRSFLLNIGKLPKMHRTVPIALVSVLLVAGSLFIGLAAAVPRQSALGHSDLQSESGTNPGGDNDGNEPNIFIPFVSMNENRQIPNTNDGHDAHDHTAIGHIPEQGRFTSNDGEVQSWPPQIKYIDEVNWDNRVSAAMLEQKASVNAATVITEQDSRVQAALGERYTFISANPIRKKGVESDLGEEVTYFSYSNNVTIEVTLRDGTVEAVETVDASEHQPPLMQNEVDAAIEIARRFWQERGNSRVDALQGFTIQTFRTEGAGGFYSTRMTYVSFHVDSTKKPELLTWVDLTTDTVFKAAIDHGSESGGLQYVQ